MYCNRQRIKFALSLYDTICSKVHFATRVVFHGTYPSLLLLTMMHGSRCSFCNRCNYPLVTQIFFKNKKPFAQSAKGIRCRSKLVRGRCIHRTHIGTGTAVNADAGIDVVLGISLGDGGHGALRLASTTADAGVRNLVCHNSYLLHMIPRLPTWHIQIITSAINLQ